MDSRISENIVLIVLSVILFTGGLGLHLRRHRLPQDTAIVIDGIEKRLTLTEIEEHLKESRRVNINTAYIEEITSIPGIGRVMASRIVEYRDAHGRFFDEKDLLEIKGLGEKKLNRIKEYIRLD